MNCPNPTEPDIKFTSFQYNYCEYYNVKPLLFEHIVYLLIPNYQSHKLSLSNRLNRG